MNRRGGIASPRLQSIVAGGLIVLAWAYSVLPNLTKVGNASRASVVVTNAGRSPLDALVGNALWLLVGVAAAATAIWYARDSRRLPPLAILPWLAVVLSATANGSRMSIATWVVPALACAITVLRPPVRVLGVVGWLTAATSAVCWLLALVTPYAWFLEDSPDITVATPASAKAIFGENLLAGFYDHPNSLGMALALGLPYVFLIRRPLWRWASVVLVAVTLVASSARTSIGAAAVALVFALVCLPLARRARAALGWVTGAAALLVIIILPLTQQDPTAFSSRGTIWISALAMWERSPWLGFGPTVFGDLAGYTTTFGPYAFHGHNAFVDSLLSTGVIGFGCWVSFVAWGIHRASRYRGTVQVVALTALMTYLFVCVLEVPYGFWEVEDLGYVVWIPLLVIGLGSDPGATGAGRPPRRVSDLVVAARGRWCRAVLATALVAVVAIAGVVAGTNRIAVEAVVAFAVTARSSDTATGSLARTTNGFQTQILAVAHAVSTVGLPTTGCDDIDLTDVQVPAETTVVQVHLRGDAQDAVRACARNVAQQLPGALLADPAAPPYAVTLTLLSPAQPEVTPVGGELGRLVGTAVLGWLVVAWLILEAFARPRDPTVARTPGPPRAMPIPPSFAADLPGLPAVPDGRVLR